MSPLYRIVRVLSALWALVACSLALLLLVVCTTWAGALFGIGAFLLGLAPILFFAKADSRRLRGASAAAFGIWLLITFWLYHSSPNGEAPAGARVQNRGAKARWRYPRFALGALLPEVDQFLLGYQLVSLVDPLFTRQQVRSLSALTRKIYAELEADADFHALGSVMPDAYDQLWGRPFDHGHYFLYIPPGMDRQKPAPVLVFLHGSGGNFKAYTWLLSRVADERGMVLIAPSFGLGNWDAEHSAPTVTAALEDAATVVPLDWSAVHLAGLSNGGLGVTQVAASAAGRRFRSLILLSAVCDESALASDDFATRWRGRPVYVLTGGMDDRVPLPYVASCASIMQNAGANVEMVTYPDADHFLVFSHREALVKQLSVWLR